MKIALKIILACLLLFMTTKIARAQLSGIKTIGGDTPDYPSFVAAVSALNTNGVGDGGVTFLFRDGSYTESVVITASGTESNPILFKSENEDSTAVTIKNASNNVITLSGSSYITFQHLTVHFSTTTNKSPIIIGKSSNNVSIKNCVLKSNYTLTQNTGALIYGSETSAANDCSNLLVENCYLSGGSFGVYFKMKDCPAGLIIRNNTIENFNSTGLDLSYLTAIIIDGNRINTNISSSNRGINLGYCYGSTEVKNNYIYTTGSGQIQYGINLGNGCSGSSSDSPAKLYNNSIQVYNNANSVYGIIQVNTSKYWDINNNTIYVSSGTANDTYGYHSLSYNAEIRFINNVIANFATGTKPYTIRVPNTAAFSEISNNCYYSNNNTQFYGTSDDYSGDVFLSFINDTGEQNSINMDPVMEFVEGVGWKATATDLSGAGTYLADVINDIDGSPRLDPTTIGSHELDSAPCDEAGILSVNAPAKPFAPGSNNVWVTLKNFGSCSLTSVSIEWEVNNIGQSNFSWTGNLASGAETSVNIGAYNFMADVVHTITVRTNSPNGNPDGNTNNDEISVYNLRPGLAGTYSVGSEADFADFTATTSALDDYGVSGAVVFEVISGTYNEQISILDVSGNSLVNTIKFKSQSGNAEDVIITSASDAVVGSATLKLASAKNTIWQNITLERSDSKTNANVVIIAGESQNNSFDTVIFSGKTGYKTSNAALVLSNDLNSENSGHLFQNCTFNSGSAGIWFQGNSSNYKSDLNIENCHFENYYYGIYLDYINNVIIDRNRISSNVSDFSGINMGHCGSRLEIKNNYIYTTGSGQIQYGIKLSTGSIGSSDSPAKLYNNSIQVYNANSASYGIDQASGCNYWDIYNNTIYVSSGTATSTYGYRSYVSNANVSFKNNVIANFATGTKPYTIFVPNTAAFSEISNNCYYSNNDNQFYGTSDDYSGDVFLSFINDTGEQNSINMDPEMEFVEGVGWKATATDLSGAGTYLADVINDIDGSPRVIPPSIGAHELDSTPCDEAGILSVNAPAKPFAPGSNNVWVTLKNFGSCSLTSVSIEWEVNNIGQSNFSWTGNLASGAETSVNIGAYNFMADVAYTITVRTNSPNNNPDGNTNNDEISVYNLRPGLAGTYSVGSEADFANFTTTTSALENYGVSGPVVFEIISGTYNEQISILDVSGNSLVNTIKFKSQSGNAEDVIITSASDTVVGSATLKLASAKNTIWQNITLERSDSITNANVVIISGESQNNSFDTVIFSGRSGSISNNAALVISDDQHSGNSGHSFQNCTFNNGSAGIWFQSNSSNYKSDLSIKNCHFENYCYGIYLNYINNVIIDNNKIINASSYSPASTTGIDLSYVKEIMLIRKNEIIKTDATNNHGIYMRACITEYNGPNDPGEISNNFILTGGSGTSYGIYSTGTTNKNFYFNTIYTKGTNSTSSRAMYINGPSGGVAYNANFVLKNNIFMADHGVPLYNSVGGIISCNYNNYYVVNNSQPVLAYWINGNVADLTALRTKNSDDENSISNNPLFVSDIVPYNLHITENSPCIGAAVAISGITDDIDGDSRNSDIGADEYTKVVLPVTCLYFNIYCLDKVVKCEWATASEINNDYFMIQISNDAMHFRNIGQVKGAGNSNQFINYSFSDENPSMENAYYRLVQVDFDGQKNIYGPVSSNCEASIQEFKLFPNPNNGDFKIMANSLIDKPASIIVFDTKGRKMYQKEFNLEKGNNWIEIDAKLNPGVYMVDLKSGKQMHTTVKMIVMSYFGY